MSFKDKLVILPYAMGLKSLMILSGFINYHDLKVVVIQIPKE